MAGQLVREGIVMNAPYQPSSAFGAKIARKLLPYRARRDMRLNLTRSVISFTFDDFPLSAIENGANLLEDEGWRATFYVAAGLARTTNHHGLHFRASDLVNLQNKGHEIAGHTFTHADCGQLTSEQVMAEISKNKTALKQMGVTGKIEHFAYPFGGATAQLKQSLAKEFKSLRGITPGIHRKTADLNGLKSAPVFSGDKLEHTLALIEQLKHKPGWLTLFAHDICDNSSAWGCTPAEFRRVVHAAKESGAHVLPIGAALQSMENGFG